MSELAHERLDVYKTALEFLVLADVFANSLGKGRAYLADQLRRAATSVTLNIAEGAGEFAPADKARFYRMARRSATECSAVLDVSRVLRLAEGEAVVDGRALLVRIVAMLTAMVVKLNRPGAGSGAGSGAEWRSDES